MNLTPRESGANIYVGDYTNPILQPWVSSELLRIGNLALAGDPVPGKQETCHPHGVPFVLGLNDSVQILQTPDEGVFLYAREMRPRIVHLNSRHPENIRHSPYGHSIGHWEGDALVVDTVGLSDDTWLDRLGTAHSEQLHVVETYRKLSAENIRVDFMIEDPIAFTVPWRAYVNYQPDDEGYSEQVCAENNRDPRAGREYDIPHDETPDF